MGGAHSSLQVQGWRAASAKAGGDSPDVHLVFCWPPQLDGAAAMVSAVCYQFCTEDPEELLARSVE
ncbi:hypothetical protein FA95DRAFT_1564279 [Auriscalpium vulgare]|uniref:Uncharacterized protein n=1 Tax=Auriscalpium vulgare TaxID=40419 RepID=A0ACB8REM9_9AGAM|nr:hypothetical protein FA95DRAFT_1564279 [Auriscalpium vulgare]